MLKKHLTPADLQALWKRLEKARGRQPSSVQEAWDSLKQLGGAKAAQSRCNTLCLYLRGKGEDINPPLWVDHLLLMHEEIARISERKVTAKPLYRGELEQLHGKAEAARFIREGKWRSKKDRDGDTVYFKVSAEQTNIARHTKSASGSRRPFFKQNLFFRINKHKQAKK